MELQTQQAVAQTNAKNNGLAITSLVLSILGIILCFIPIIGVVGLILGIISIIFSVIGKKQIKNSNGTQKGSGMATAGLVIGIITLVIGTIITACSLAMVGFLSQSPEFNDMMNEFQNMPIK